MKRLLLVLLCLNLSSGYVFAGKKTVYKKTQEVSFESTDVDGLVRSPDGAYLAPRKGVKFMSLYKINNTFDKDIKNSVEHLR